MAAAQFENDARLQDAIDAFVGKAGTAGRELRLPAGRYHMNVPLTFNGINGVVVNAHGVELFGHAPDQPIVMLTNCQNVTLSGLSVDWDPEHLPFTQGTITTLDDNRRRVTVRLHRGYSRQCDPGAGHTVIVAAHTERIDGRDVRMVRSETRWDWSIEAQQGDIVVLRKGGDASKDEEQVGDYIVIPTTDVDPRTNRTHAVVTRDCQHVVMRDVTVYASGCFAFFDEFCEATTFDRCRVIPRPLANELVEREFERLSSSNADAIHSKDARQGVVVTNCQFFCHRDDGVAIHGTYFFVLKSENDVIELLVPNIADFNAVFYVGAHLDALDVSGTRRSRSAAVTGITRDENVGAAEIDIERALQAWHPSESEEPRMDVDKLRALRECTRRVSLHMSEHVDLAPGSLVAVESRLGHDFSVRFCEFGPSRARGVLAKASRGRINNNTLIGQRRSAVLVCPEFWWLEAGCGDNIEIHGNIIHRCHAIPIHVHATTPLDVVPREGVYVHNDIRVTGNTIRDCVAEVKIRVTSTAGVIVARNGAGVRKKIEHCIDAVNAD